MNKAIHYATKKLRIFREDRDWSQRQLAEFLSLQLNEKISQVTVNYWETGKRAMTAEKALQISNATRIPVMELVARRED